jgi:GNAT superfamily N-acetyltransferase
MHLETRLAGGGDIETICSQRERMFEEAGLASPSHVEPFRTWLAPRIADQRYLGWIVESEGMPVAGIGMMFIDWPPHPNHPSEDLRGYICNVFVERSHRRMGIARRMMGVACDEARSRGVHYLVLHASPQGRPLYEADGWSGTNEMRLILSET